LGDPDHLWRSIAASGGMTSGMMGTVHRLHSDFYGSFRCLVIDAAKECGLIVIMDVSNLMRS
jgi:hypothetical protein